MLWPRKKRVDYMMYLTVGANAPRVIGKENRNNIKTYFPLVSADVQVRLCGCNDGPFFFWVNGLFGKAEVHIRSCFNFEKN